MTEEKGCWNCKHDELGPDDDPCVSCVSYDPILSKWERGEQVSLLQSSKLKETGE